MKMKRRLIDAVELEDKLGCGDRDIYAKEYIKEAPTVLTIPENPTNGDVIKAMFPNCVIDEDFCGAVITSIDQKQYWSKEWWNAPYKREVES